MVVKIELENLEELKHICECLEYCLKDDKVHPDNREQVKKIAEQLRNNFEGFSDIKK